MAAPEAVWSLVTDVSKWRRWLLGVDMVQLNGSLVTGTQGLLFLADGKVNRLVVQKYDLGRLEALVFLPYGVKMFLLIDVSTAPSGSQVKMEGELVGVFSILHLFGWGRNLKTGIIPTTRRLGMLGHDVNI